MLFFNEDWMHHIWTRNEAGVEITEESLREFIYQYKGSQITDFVMNINGTVSTADSKVFETFADKYLATEENGIPVDYKNTFAVEAYKLIYEKKIDMYKVWIEALKEIGIHPWLSFRMNDCHGSGEVTELRKSSYIDKHPEYHVAAHRERTSYFDRCLDYSHAEVRQRMLSFIDEQLGKYDVYGIELDFMRESVFVQCGREYGGTAVMREFIENVIAIVEKYEKKYCHTIKRSVILSSSPNLTIERGMNVFDFTDKLDNIIIIPRWETIDTDMPIEVWKQLLHGTKVKLGCGQQILFKPYRGYKPTTLSVKMAFGQAAANLSRGCDFVYLYNYMDFGNREGAIAEWMYESSVRNDANHPFIFRNIGKLDTLVEQERSHVVTYSDFWRYDIPACSVLPISYPAGDNEYAPIKIPVGKVPEGARVRLILGICPEEKVEPQDIRAYINATECEFEEVTRIEEKIYENDCYVFTVGGEMYGIMYAEVRISKKCRLEYVEIEVIPEKK